MFHRLLLSYSWLFNFIIFKKSCNYSDATALEDTWTLSEVIRYLCCFFCVFKEKVCGEAATNTGLLYYQIKMEIWRGFIQMMEFSHVSDSHVTFRRPNYVGSKYGYLKGWNQPLQIVSIPWLQYSRNIHRINTNHTESKTKLIFKLFLHITKFRIRDIFRPNIFIGFGLWIELKTYLVLRLAAPHSSGNKYMVSGLKVGLRFEKLRMLTGNNREVTDSRTHIQALSHKILIKWRVKNVLTALFLSGRILNLHRTYQTQY